MMSLPTGNEEISRASIAPRSVTSSFRPPRWSPSPLPASDAPRRRRRRRRLAEVEALQPRHGLGLAARDAVEVVLHPGGEVVVDEPPEVLLQQVDHGEGEEGRHEGRALLEDVAAVEDGADDRGVRRRAADLALFELLDQRGLGVAGRGLGGVPVDRDLLGGQRVALGDLRQPALAVVQLGVRVVGALDVRLQEAVEGDRLAGGGELGVPAVARPAADLHGDASCRPRPSSGRRRSASRSARRAGTGRRSGRSRRACGSGRPRGGSPRAPPARS